MDTSRQATALVVDNDELNRKLAARILASSGFRVVEACDGIHALTVIKLQPVDVILLDVMMPGLSGFEVCCRLKSDPATCSIPVVLVTILGSGTSRRAGFAAGADAYISKPYRKADLLAAVHRVVRGPEHREE